MGNEDWTRRNRDLLYSPLLSQAFLQIVWVKHEMVGTWTEVQESIFQATENGEDSWCLPFVMLDVFMPFQTSTSRGARTTRAPVAGNQVEWDFCSLKLQESNNHPRQTSSYKSCLPFIGPPISLTSWRINIWLEDLSQATSVSLSHLSPTTDSLLTDKSSSGACPQPSWPYPQLVKTPEFPI